VNILTILPLAFVMIAGPQILCAIFLATSEDWGRNSAAFLVGAALSVTLFVTIAYWVGRGINSAGGDNTLDIVVLASIHRVVGSDPSDAVAKMTS
jgi:small neutral amino acid transporter SnatA (MarC family)